jgi:hypothetical protein
VFQKWKNILNIGIYATHAAVILEENLRGNNGYLKCQNFIEK